MTKWRTVVAPILPLAAFLAGAAILVFAAPVQLPQTLTGGGGSTWEVNPSGGTNNGLPTGTQNFSPGLNVNDVTLGSQGDAYDFGLEVWINDAVVVPPGAANADADRTGQVVTVGPISMAGLLVTVAYSAMPSTPRLRTLVTLSNPSFAGGILVTVKWITNVGSDNLTVIRGSSNGNTTFESSDRWLVTSDDLMGSDVVNGHVLFGPRNPALRPSAVSMVGPNDGGDATSVVASYPLIVPPGSTRYLLFYNQVSATSTAALQTITTFDSNPTGELTAGLPTSTLWRIFNFDFVPARTDFDGDDKADVVVYRPSAGQWWVNRSLNNFTDAFAVQWGAQSAGDQPAPADFDGDGKTDPTIFRPAAGGNSIWFVNRSSTNYTSSFAVPWGTEGDQPVPGYYDADALGDPAVFRPGTGQWFVKRSSTGYTDAIVVEWGMAGDVLVPADYDGDGRTDMAVYRPSLGQWFIRGSDSEFTFPFALQWGVQAEGDIPVPADYDGDGKADPTVYRPGTGHWFVRRSSTGYIDSFSVQWGVQAEGDQPMPADFDGDGKADPTVYRPGAGQWFVRRSSTNYTTSIVVQWGSQAQGDIPIRER